MTSLTSSEINCQQFRHMIGLEEEDEEASKLNGKSITDAVAHVVQCNDCEEWYKENFPFAR